MSRPDVEGTGTADDPWILLTPPGKSEFEAYRAPEADPPALVVQVGATELRYHLRCMLEEIDMPWNWPVEVNYLEAKAFCQWQSAVSGKSLRLPTETEWYRLRDSVLDTDQPYWPVAPGNINLERYASSCPVDECAFGDFYDIVGNVWQWTETPISGFAGFEVHPWYDDFSTPTFDTQHNLIKGGSWISTGNEATRDSRYAFRRHFYQHAGFRYVESEADEFDVTDVRVNADYLPVKIEQLKRGKTNVVAEAIRIQSKR